jgi:hypothetical protein
MPEDFQSSGLSIARRLAPNEIIETFIFFCPSTGIHEGERWDDKFILNDSTRPEIMNYMNNNHEATKDSEWP